MENLWWALDRDLSTKNMATEWRLEQFNGGTNWNIFGNDYRNVIFTNTEYKVSPYNLYLFDSMDKAEQYLLSTGFSTSNGEFYSIRKIYK